MPDNPMTESLPSAGSQGRPAEGAELAALLRQQTTLARFGERALRSDNLDEILTEACHLVGEALGTDLAKVVELQADGETLRVRAGVGWKPGVVGVATIKVADDTSEGHALKTCEPAISHDIAQETRFRYPSFLIENGVKAVANVVILGAKGRPPFGILQIDSRTPRVFTDDDTAFLRSYANLIAASVDRLHAIGEARRGEARMRALNADLERQVIERSHERGRMWQHSPDLFSVIDLSRAAFDKVNPAWTTALGWTSGEIEGRPYVDFVHPDDAGVSAAAFEQARHGDPVLRFENRYRTKDGSWRWLSWVSMPEGDKLYSSTRDVTAEKEQAEALRLTETRAATYFNFSEDYLFLVRVGADGIARFEDMNPACERVMGLVRADVIGRAVDQFVPSDSARDIATHSRLCLETRQSQTYHASRMYREGHQVVIEGRVAFVEHSGDGGGLVLFSGHDITEQRSVEAALRQSQKMEAVGQLTGGLAHDFNNLLTGVTGSLELLQTRIAQGRIKDVDRYVNAAQGAAKRAAALTHRLLAFSRRQTLDPKPTDVNRLVLGMEDMIRRTVGPEITVEPMVGAAGLWPTLVDPSQLENALLNLCINARDAMPGGGKITIETGNCWLDARTARERGLPPGQYVSLCVSDTGTGMTPDVIARAFDPFFTTKPIGQGTGLGLSMIYGFAQQSGGQVRIYSEVGQGAVVCMYLPRHLGEADVAELAPELADAPRAEDGQTVLVVDDEPTVRMLVTEVLEDLGYRAIEAADGTTGLQVLQSDVRIDLLVTDVGLPGGMNGRQVADAARLVRPDLKVLFITGYVENAVLSHGHLDPGMHVLTKPFALEALASRIKDLIAD